MRPMLAGKLDLRHLKFPMFGSAKLDGVRAIVDECGVMSRTWKAIPNLHVQRMFSREELLGFDGELIVGSPTSKSCYRDTSSGVMSIDGTPDVKFYVFDHTRKPGAFHLRRRALKAFDGVEVLEQRWLQSLDEMLEFEEECVSAGYEGIILRAPDGPYKQGRSTSREGYMIKVKRWEDSEAVILGMVELQRNLNEKVLDERGYSKRSHCQDGKVGGDTLGALQVRDLKSGVEFEIGSGFTAAEKDAIWGASPIGKIVKYKFFPVGVKDKPRQPIFLGFRDPSDM